MSRNPSMSDLLAAERGERGIGPVWRSHGLLSGRYTRVLPNEKGTVEVHFVYSDHESGLRWIWTLTGNACVEHPSAKGRAKSAYACMSAAEIFALEHYP